MMNYIIVSLFFKNLLTFPKQLTFQDLASANLQPSKLVCANRFIISKQYNQQEGTHFIKWPAKLSFYAGANQFNTEVWEYHKHNF